jgi:hypothetical protein
VARTWAAKCQQTGFKATAERHLTRTTELGTRSAVRWPGQPAAVSSNTRTGMGLPIVELRDYRVLVLKIAYCTQTSLPLRRRDRIATRSEICAPQHSHAACTCAVMIVTWRALCQRSDCPVCKDIGRASMTLVLCTGMGRVGKNRLLQILCRTDESKVVGQPSGYYCTASANTLVQKSNLSFTLACDAYIHMCMYIHTYCIGDIRLRLHPDV